MTASSSGEQVLPTLSGQLEELALAVKQAPDHSTQLPYMVIHIINAL